jgi:UDP-N-acetylmuramate--alanine ligase
MTTGIIPQKRPPPCRQREQHFPADASCSAFQPHRYTRTRDRFEDFVRVLSTADVLLLTEVYPAGEAPIVLADGRSLARAIRVAGKIEPIFAESIDDLSAALLDVVRDGDVVIANGRRFDRSDGVQVDGRGR